MEEPPEGVAKRKKRIRAQARANRDRQQDREQLSREICRRLTALPEYVAAKTVLFYVDFRSEVRTQYLLAAACRTDKCVVVPYCLDDRLGLFRLRGMDELSAGVWGILEPQAELRGLADRRVDAARLDLVVVPGVAFDRRGGRTGYGKGYYDKLLLLVRPDTAKVALAFECQLFAEIPMQPHDVFVDKVVTEKAVYQL